MESRFTIVDAFAVAAFHSEGVFVRIRTVLVVQTGSSRRLVSDDVKFSALILHKGIRSTKFEQPTNWSVRTFNKSPTEFVMNNAHPAYF